MRLERTVYVFALAAVLLVFGVIAVCGAERSDGIVGKVPNYQYANIAPLPGAGIAIDAKGNLDGNGAMQLNIPVAYTPGWGYVSLNEFQGEHPVHGSPRWSNGSSIFGLGFFSTRRVYMSGMQVSRVWEEAKTLSGQMVVLDETEKMPAISLGMQDILKKEPNGRSPYLVVTKSLEAAGHPLYATLGYGGGRFLRKPFAGISMPVAGCVNLLAEWDGFQMNSGVAYRPGGRSGKLTVMAAYNGHAGILVGGSVACTFAR